MEMPYITASLAARYLKISSSTVINAIKEGRLSGYQCGEGGSWLVETASTMDFKCLPPGRPKRAHPATEEVSLQIPQKL